MIVWRTFGEEEGFGKLKILRNDKKEANIDNEGDKMSEIKSRPLRHKMQRSSVHFFSSFFPILTMGRS